ncbi:hypothetical protein SNE40_006125 [Patella caerulea]|uniref:Beta-lactamase-related domain-containing protein n=1 Tax=Patella caerulea TaxID=87958 RepID=A0AAN8K8Y4_PATCE
MVFKRCLCLFGLITLSSCQIFSPIQTREIEDFVASVMECVRVPGLTLAVVKGNETWNKGFGYADVENKRPVNTSTLFGIGSITKAFTSMLLSMHIEERSERYNWTSKLRDVLGEDFKMVDEIRSNETMLRDILAHRTGLTTGDIGLIAGYPTVFTRKEMVKRLHYLGELKPFRDTFVYNNWMYALAGYIVEVLSGNTWEEELRARILDPLEMLDTRIIDIDINVTDDKMAKPYAMVDDDVIPSPPEIYTLTPGEPAGAIASSAEDMSKWIQFILSKGNLTDGQTLANWTIYKEAFQAHNVYPSSLEKPTFPIADVNEGYGYGWFHGNHDGYKKLWHSGGLFGYSAMLWIFPDLDIGFFSNINGPAGAADTSKVFTTIFPYIFDLIMEKEPWLNKTTACSYPSPWAPKSPSKNNTDDVTNLPVDDVSQFVGEYGHRFLGDVQIIAYGQSLYFNMTYLQGTLNTTKKSNEFKMETTGRFAFLTHPGNTTQLLPVVFDTQRSNKYQRLTISFGDNSIFERGVKWTDPLPTATSGCGSLLDNYTKFHLLVIVLICSNILL